MRHAAAESTSAEKCRCARRRLSYWKWWLIAPLLMLLTAATFRLERNFFAVGLLFAAMIIIRLVQAWSDLDQARQEEARVAARKQSR